MTAKKKIAKKIVNTYGDEMTIFDLDDAEILDFSTEHDPFKHYSHFGGSKYDQHYLGTWEEYLLNRHSPLRCYRTISEHLKIEWDRICTQITLRWLLKKDYPILIEKLTNPTINEIKAAISSAIEFIDGKTDGTRNDELLQAMKFYAVALILGEDKKQRSAALEYIQKSKEIWSKYRKLE